MENDKQPKRSKLLHQWQPGDRPLLAVEEHLRRKWEERVYPQIWVSSDHPRIQGKT